MTQPVVCTESDLVALRRLAEDLARGRKERVTSGHLLAAIVSRPSTAADLLIERKLGAETLLKAARATTDEDPDPIPQSMMRAREVAARLGAATPTALHLLIALLNDRRTGAHNALAQCGVDLWRLRAAAMQLALGRVGARRSSRAETSDPGDRGPAPGPSRSGSGTTMTRGDRRRPTRLGGTTVSLLPAMASPPAGHSAPAGHSTPASHAAPSGHSTPAGHTVVSSPAPSTAVTVPTVPVPSPSSPPPPAKLFAKPAAHAPGAGGKAIPIVHAPARRKPARGSTAHGARASAGGVERYALDPKHFPNLAQIGKNLTLAAANGELDPIIGRDLEIDQALDVLAKRHANNPLLVGPAGVGKTSIVRGIAQRIVRGEGCLSLDDRIIVEVPISELVAGSGVRGSLAERLGTLRSEVRQADGRVVLFFDEMHTLFSGDLADEAESELKVALARGELPCIGATTIEDFRRVIEADHGLARRFTVVEVDEPSREDALLVLRGVADGLETHHGVTYADEALALAIAWSVQYLPGRTLPDKAVSIVDLAGARARRRSIKTIDPEAVAEVVAELADVPVERMLETDRERMLALEKILGERVVGHDAALARIATILRRNAAGLRGRRPIGTFLLLGPTGVGKTETAKAVAEALFHSPDAMTRLDFAEYAEAHAVARLIGAPPGYVGHEAGGQLTEAVRRRPYQVILLDEIEKAHRDVLEAFLGVFDEGRLTDGRGKTVDFTNTVIMLTSNIGAVEASAKATRGIGFARSAEAEAVARSRAGDAVVAAARSALPPELYNRLDEVIAFTPLSRADVTEIARRLLRGLAKSLAEVRGVELDIDDEAIAALLDAGGFDPELGARPMKRTLARLVEAPLADMILRDELAEGDVVRLTTDDAGALVVDSVRRSA